jgi:hypothetical protein
MLTIFSPDAIIYPLFTGEQRAIAGQPDIGVVILFAWFTILFTGSYPRVLFEQAVNGCRQELCIQAYGLLLVIDKYPPFSLKKAHHSEHFQD